jgi:hypothetical protein
MTSSAQLALGDSAPPPAWLSNLPTSAKDLKVETRADREGGEFISFHFAGARIHYLHADVQHISRSRPCRNSFKPMAVIPCRRSSRLSKTESPGLSSRANLFSWMGGAFHDRFQ